MKTIILVLSILGLFLYFYGMEYLNKISSNEVIITTNLNVISYNENSVEQTANNFMKKIYPEVNNFIVECSSIESRVSQICTASGRMENTFISSDRQFFLLECNRENCYLKFTR